MLIRLAAKTGTFPILQAGKYGVSDARDGHVGQEDFGQEKEGDQLGHMTRTLFAPSPFFCPKSSCPTPTLRLFVTQPDKHKMHLHTLSSFAMNPNSKIRHPAIFSAVFEKTSKMLQQGSVPLKLVRDHTWLARNTPLRYATDLLGGKPRFSRATANGVRTVRDGKKDENRWSGIGLDGVRSQGGLYLSTHLDALSNEMLHYGRQDGAEFRQPDGQVAIRLGDILAGTRAGNSLPTEDRMLLQKVIVNFRTQAHLLVVDLSADSENAEAFHFELSSNPEVKKALSGKYRSSIEASLASGGA